eukprot:3816497-Alexandrium_andersonii.AAC.1
MPDHECTCDAAVKLCIVFRGELQFAPRTGCIPHYLHDLLSAMERHWVTNTTEIEGVNSNI